MEVVLFRDEYKLLRKRFDTSVHAARFVFANWQSIDITG